LPFAPACRQPPFRCMLPMMSALEIIEQIKVLPPEEKAKVVDYVRQLQVGPSAMTEVRLMDQAEFNAAKERMFSKHADLLKKLAQ